MTQYDIAANEKEWLALRSKGLGGSDIGSVLGLNHWKSPFQLWAEKTGQVEPDDISDHIPIIVGNELEETVARLFERESGLKVQRDNKTHYHKDYPFLLANIDRKIIGQKALLECKTTSVFNKDEWTEDEVPVSYLLQVQHYLNVLDYDVAYIAVLIGNTNFVYKKIKRDDELIEIYQAKAVNFWEEHVVKGIPPEIDGSDASTAFISKMYSDDYEESATELDVRTVRLIDELMEMKEDKKLIDKSIKEKENRIKDYLGSRKATYGNSPTWRVTYDLRNRVGVDSKKLKNDFPDIYDQVVKTTSYKTMTVKGLK